MKTFKEKVIENFRNRYIKEPVYGDLRITNGKEYDLSNDLEIFISSSLDLYAQEIKGVIEGMKRTDETQMSHDHTYDEALSDVLNSLSEKGLLTKE